MSLAGAITTGAVMQAKAQLAHEAKPAVSMIGTRTMLFEAPGEFSLRQQRRIWALTEEAQQRHDVAEVAPGVTNLMLVFTEPPDPHEIAAWLLRAWSTLPEKHIKGNLFEIGVCYGGELGNDLPIVAEHAGMSQREVVTRHAAGTYTVLALGSAPGFGYLHGLDPRIAMPRKSVPTLKMLAGTVIIGGIQTGISALTGPNGWNSIGFTEVSLFDPERESPSLFQIGDRVRFHAESIDV